MVGSISWGPKRGLKERSRFWITYFQSTNREIQKLEKAALKNGYAVAIGHPKEVTLNALATWIPDARSRGFEIVRAGDLITEIRLSNRELPVSEKSAQDTEEKTALLKSF